MTGAETTEHGGHAPVPAQTHVPSWVGKYRVDGIIGRGAVGIVYQGYDEHIDRPLAIKTLRLDAIADQEQHETALKRFAQEARSAGRCLHPNIVAVFDYVEQDGAPYIIMEYVPAGTLENVINSGVIMPVRQVGEVMTQLLLALDHAHGKGVIHRDVKPANILCPSASSIKVTDFGVARFDAMGLTNPNGFGAVGTPNYMSPEQFLGQPLDSRSDLYAAGVIMFQLLAGARPFVANDVPELMRKLLNDTPPPLATLRPGAGPELDGVLQRALARNPEDRFAGADAFIDAVNNAIDASAADNDPPLDLTAVSVAQQQAEPGGYLSQTMAARLRPETLGAVCAALVREIGPIAQVAVERAAQEATDPDMLLTHLSSLIPDGMEAIRFREMAERTIEADHGVAPRVLGGSKVAPASIDAAIKALLPLIGPVAKVLAERVAGSAVSKADYLRQLSDAIPDEADRAKFTAAMRASEPDQASS